MICVTFSLYMLTFSPLILYKSYNRKLSTNSKRKTSVGNVRGNCLDEPKSSAENGCENRRSLGSGPKCLLVCIPNTNGCFSTYSALYAAGRLSEQLRLWVLHLRGVEDLLVIHLVEVQEAREPHGGCAEKRRQWRLWSHTSAPPHKPLSRSSQCLQMVLLVSGIVAFEGVGWIVSDRAGWVSECVCVWGRVLR